MKCVGIPTNNFKITFQAVVFTIHSIIRECFIEQAPPTFVRISNGLTPAMYALSFNPKRKTIAELSLGSIDHLSSTFIIMIMMS